MVSSNCAASRSSVCTSPLENPLGTRLAATSPSWVVVFCWRSSAAGCSSPNSCRNGHRRGRRCVRRRDGALPDSQRPALDAGTFGSKRHRIAPRGPPPSAGSGRHERRPAEPHSAHPGPDRSRAVPRSPVARGDGDDAAHQASAPSPSTRGRLLRWPPGIAPAWPTVRRR